jgi:hypothetical protein
MAKNRINIAIGANLKQFSTDMQNVKREMRKTSRKMKSLGQSMTRSLTVPLGLMGGAMIKFASDTQESLNKVNVAFGDSSTTVKDFAKTTLKSFGIAEGSALDMASTFGDMATSMGIGQDAAAQMSTKLVGLAGDLASFKNIRIDVAQTALNSIFTGETESLKKLGIVMTQANLSAFALEKGITKPIKAMSEGEKVMLRYNYVMEKTANSHGDFERTGGGAANQMRVFQEGLKELAATFGKIILPMFTKVVSKANEIIQAFGNLSESTKKWILAIGGLVAVVGPLISMFGNLIGFVFKSNLTIKAFAASAAFLLSPLGLLVGVLSIVALRFRRINQIKQNAARVNKELYSTINAENVLRKKTYELAHKERYEVESLLSIAQDETKTKTERLRAIEKLNSINPKYINGINLENVKTKEVTTQVQNYINKIKQKAKIQAASLLLQEEYDKQIKTEIQIAKKQEEQTAEIAKRNQELSDIIEGKNMQGGATQETIQAERKAINKTNQEYERQIKLLKNKSAAISENINKLIEAGGVEQLSTTPNGSLDLSGGEEGGYVKTSVSDIISIEPKDVSLLNEYVDGVDRFSLATKQIAPITVEVSTAWSRFTSEMRNVGQVIGSTFQVINAHSEEFKNNMINAAQALRDGIINLSMEAFEGFFVAIGQSITKQEDAFKNFGKQTLENVANFMSQFGKLLVAGAIASEAMQKMLFTNPVAAAAAGVALIAIAGTIKGMTSQNPTEFGGGQPSYSPPSTGIGSGSTYGTSNDVMTLETVVYGRDIVLSSNRQHGTISRTRRK